MVNLDIINEIKANKKLNKMTSLELSKKSGVPLGTLNKILAGQTDSLKVETLNKINSAFIKKADKNIKENLGLIKVASVSPSVKVCDVDYNVEQIIRNSKIASDKGAKLIVFPELSITASTCGDLFYQDALLDSALLGLNKIVQYSSNLESVILVGLPFKYNGLIYDVCAVLSKGEILGLVPKVYTPSYNEFYLSRQFKSGFEGIKEVEINGKFYPFSKNLIFKSKSDSNFSFSVEIGSDMCLNVSPYQINAEKGSLICANLSSFNEVVGRGEELLSIIKGTSKKCVCGYILANSGYEESTTDLIYSGRSYIVENGELLAENKPFESQMLLSDIDVEFLSFERSKQDNFVNFCEDFKTVYFDIDNKQSKIDREFYKFPFVKDEKDYNNFELILNMQAYALARRVKHINANKLVLGLSGGLDSTLALIACVRAMDILKRDRKDILAITLPCFGTTSRTKNNAIIMAEEFKVSLKEVNIKKAVEVHFSDIGQDINKYDITFENSQARERTQVLMDIANMNGGIVIGTGDLSEVALGWSTYNGDHMSMYSLNASLPKTLIRFLINYEANRLGGKIKEVLLDVINTPVSPELIPAKNGEIVQKTEEKVGPYILQDFYLYYAIFKGYRPKKVYEIAIKTFEGDYSNQEILNWLKHFYNRFFTQQFKRSCMPDGVKITCLGLSPRGDLKMPSDAVRKVWLKELEDITE